MISNVLQQSTFTEVRGEFLQLRICIVLTSKLKKAGLGFSLFIVYLGVFCCCCFFFLYVFGFLLGVFLGFFLYVCVLNKDGYILGSYLRSLKIREIEGMMVYAGSHIGKQRDREEMPEKAGQSQNYT